MLVLFLNSQLSCAKKAHGQQSSMTDKIEEYGQDVGAETLQSLTINMIQFMLKP